MVQAHPFLLRARERRPQIDYAWNIVVLDTDIPEGDVPTWVLTVTPPPLPGDTVSVSIRELTFAELGLASDAGRAKGSDFTQSFADAIEAAAVAELHTTHLDSLGTQRIYFGEDFDGTWNIPWPSANNPGDGDKLVGLRIFHPNRGTLGVVQDVVTIRDSAVQTAPSFTQAPSISGPTTVGSTLSRNASVVTGSPTPTVTWQWRRNAVAVGAANAPTLTTTGFTANDLITIMDTAANGVLPNATSTSAAVTLTGATGVAPVCTQITTMQGPNPPQVGSQVAWSPFTWTGSPAPTVTRRVQANSVTVAGSNPSAYPVPGGDLGKTLRAQEVADNGVGSPVTANSTQSQAVIAAGGGALTNVTVSADTILFDGAPGTFIASFQAQGGPIGSATFAAGGDAGGRVAINGTAGLVIGAVVPNFGIDQSPALGSPNPVRDYSATINFVGSNGGNFQRTYTFRMRCPVIAPTGGAGGLEVVVNSLAQVRAELENPTTAPRIIRFNPAVNTVIETNSSAEMATIEGKENFTFIGHRRVIFGKDSAALNITSAKNFRFINCAFRPGAQVTAFDQRGNRDCAFIRHAENFSFEYCDFSWSIDELFSIIRSTTTGYPCPRRGLIYRCLCAEPHTAAGHDRDEANHPFGPLTYDKTHQVWFVQCAFFDSQQRNPRITQRSFGMVVQNCLMANWQSGGANSGTAFGNSGTFDNNYLTTALVRGNLYKPLFQTVQNRRLAIRFSSVGGGGAICIEPSTSVYANHLFQGNCSDSPNLAADPYPPTDVWLDNSSTLASVVATPAFEFEGFPPDPTGTLAQRTALLKKLAGEFDNVVGVRTFGGGSGDPLTTAPDPGWLAMSYVGWEIFTRMGTGGAPVHLPAGGYFTNPPHENTAPVGQPSNATNGIYIASEDQTSTNPNRYNTGVPT